MAQLQQRSMEAAIAEEEPDPDPASRGSSAPSSTTAATAASAATLVDGHLGDPVDVAALESASANGDAAAQPPLSDADSRPVVSPPESDSQPMALPPAGARPVAVPPRSAAPPDPALRPSPAETSGRGPSSGGGGFSWPPLGREYGGSLPMLLRRQSGSALMASTQSQVGSPLLLVTTHGFAAIAGRVESLMHSSWWVGPAGTLMHDLSRKSPLLPVLPLRSPFDVEARQEHQRRFQCVDLDVFMGGSPGLRVYDKPIRRKNVRCRARETVGSIAAQVAPTDELGDAAVDLVEQLLEAYFMQVRPSTTGSVVQ